MTKHAEEQKLLREQTLAIKYGVQIYGEIDRKLEEFANNPDGKKRPDCTYSSCMKLSIDELYLVIIFKIEVDVIKVITLFPTNKRSTIEKFC
ncbi:hypothetical protein SJAV_20310 [Sulfurisphaera javensis]|uniref:Uncharacterized protein n=1 Tax=Sulfurisphaera javensis TaxID=2049879 RepID=A0AAT9GT38_9CREN